MSGGVPGAGREEEVVIVIEVPGSAASGPGVEVSVLRVALDGTVVRFLRGEFPGGGMSAGVPGRAVW